VWHRCLDLVDVGMHALDILMRQVMVVLPLTHILLPYPSNPPHGWGFMEGIGNGTLTHTLVYPYPLPVQV
jgi:hypothetical protein